MREILTILLLAALLTVALKIAFVFLILAGSIFGTHETVGLIVILAIFAGFRGQAAGIITNRRAILAILYEQAASDFLWNKTSTKLGALSLRPSRYPAKRFLPSVKAGRWGV
ncbi:hypothetical protein, partial [Novosphingobium sp. PASSN1]|uniref:hypothetical protein n=1 Tax=Novosphingobium sp. PASSN1 TaxID=2015561 RepID=UPI000BCABDA2